MAKKISQEEAEKKTKKAGCQLTGVYINSYTHTIFKCAKCDNEFTRKPSDVWRYCRILCLQCSPISVKFTEKEAAKKDAQVGFTRLDKYDGANGNYRYICPCCQREFYSRPANIWNGTTKSCGCRKKTGCQLLSGEEWGAIKECARKRRIPFNMTVQDAWEKFELQNGKCCLTGVALTLNQHKQNRRGDASLDRIDSFYGYDLDNTWWIHKTLNLIKNDLNLDRFMTLCELVYHPLQHNRANIEILPKKHGHSFKGVGNLPKSCFSTIKNGAKIRNIDFNISMQDMWSLFIQQCGYCSITGLPLIFGRKAACTASLDRIDSKKGYILNNIQWVHKDINRMKWDLSYNKLLKWCTKVIKHYEQEELPRTILSDIDGTLLKHQGNIQNIIANQPEVLDGVLDNIQNWQLQDYKIILTTGRPESLRNLTQEQLQQCGITYDELIMDCRRGKRIIINDRKSHTYTNACEAINVQRNTTRGIKQCL